MFKNLQKSKRDKRKFRVVVNSGVFGKGDANEGFREAAMNSSLGASMDPCFFLLEVARAGTHPFLYTSAVQ